MSNAVYSLLLHVHSIGRWFVLLLLVIAFFNSLFAGSRAYTRGDLRTGTILTIFADGIALWFGGSRGYKMIQQLGMSGVMKDSTTRFFAVEHLTMMLIAIILIHIGKAQGKKVISDKAKHLRTVIFYGLALLLILISIPWPFRTVGSGSGWY